MKQLILLIVSFALISTAYADDSSAALRIKISNAAQNSSYYLCITDVYCINVAAGKPGKSFPITAGAVDKIIMVNPANNQMYPQTLPASCQVTLDKNQTMTVSGKIVQASNNKAIIKNLNCAVA